LRKYVQLRADTYPWSLPVKVTVGGGQDQEGSTVETMICHRNFAPEESAMSSTERELLAIYHLVSSAKSVFEGTKVTVHTDSMNAQIICSKGSQKPRLHAYAVVWIPRDLNIVADHVSNLIDYADYEIVPERFVTICSSLGVEPDIDLFANFANRKCKRFLSATFEPETSGVDAFNYNWSLLGTGWVFVQPSLIGRVLNFAKTCKSHIVVLIPQWKNSYFYPLVKDVASSRNCKGILVEPGMGLFQAGFDKTTVFSDKFNGNVEVLDLNFCV
jgi:hypothetical protein